MLSDTRDATSKPLTHAVTVMVDHLHGFLSDHYNTRTRESLTNFRIFYDLKLAAAMRGYDLSLYIPDVDRDGFDLILDDLDVTIKIQLKSVLKGSNSGPWKIHKSMLRPAPQFCEQLGFEPSPSGTGVQGGVILMELDIRDCRIDFTYYYTDILLITALRLGIVERKPAVHSSTIDTFYKELNNGLSNDKVSVPKSLFIRSRGPEHLLGLMGLHNRITNAWWHHLISLGEDEFLSPVSHERFPAHKKSELRKIVASNLNQLSDGVFPSA